MMRIGSGNHSQRAAKHRVNAISQNHHIRFENIIPGLDASDLVSFTNQCIDAYARDKLRARLLGLFPSTTGPDDYAIRYKTRVVEHLVARGENSRVTALSSVKKEIFSRVTLRSTGADAAKPGIIASSVWA